MAADNSFGLFFSAKWEMVEHVSMEMIPFLEGKVRLARESQGIRSRVLPEKSKHAMRARVCHSACVFLPSESGNTL